MSELEEIDFPYNDLVRITTRRQCSVFSPAAARVKLYPILIQACRRNDLETIKGLFQTQLLLEYIKEYLAEDDLDKDTYDEILLEIVSDAILSFSYDQFVWVYQKCKLVLAPEHLTVCCAFDVQENILLFESCEDFEESDLDKFLPMKESRQCGTTKEIYEACRHPSTHSSTTGTLSRKSRSSFKRVLLLAEELVKRSSRKP